MKYCLKCRKCYNLTKAYFTKIEITNVFMDNTKYL